MTHDVLHWEDVLRRHGHRVTVQRGAILDAVCIGGGHKALDDILAEVRRHDCATDRSTVYRALHLFVELGLVNEAKLPAGETRYEIRKVVPHHHLVCQSCGVEQEVEDGAIQEMIDAIHRDHGFRVANDHLVLHGQCARCEAAFRELQAEPQRRT